MRYINTKTGAIIDSPCSISGGNWIEEKKETEEIDKEVKVTAGETNETTETTEEIVKTDNVEETKGTEGTEVDPDGDFNGITIAQIKQELDAFGIQYNPKAKKQELYDLMIKGR